MQVLIVKNLLERHVVFCATNRLVLSPEFAKMSCSTVKVLVDRHTSCKYFLPITEQCDNTVTGAELFCKLRCRDACRGQYAMPAQKLCDPQFTALELPTKIPSCSTSQRAMDVAWSSVTLIASSMSSLPTSKL